MGRHSMKRMVLIDHGFLILILLLFFRLRISSSSGVEKPNGVCISKGGRFAPYELEGKPPKPTGRGSKDLNLCRVFRRKTCCSAAQTHLALLAVRNLASYGEASQDCLHLFELLECSICDPNVGVQPGLPRICASFCDRVFEGCLDAYFGVDAITQVLRPCGENEIICGKALKWVSNGTDFCNAAGFTVQNLDDTKGETCYGSRRSLDSVVESWKSSSRAEVPLKSETLSSLEDFLQWVQEMTLNEKITWAVGVISLASGMFFMSTRKSRHQRQKLAAIQRTARRLGENLNQNAYRTSGNQRISQR